MKQSAPATAAIALMICAASAGAVVMAGVRTAHDLAQKEERRLRGKIDGLHREIEELEYKLAVLLAPERIEREARSRGMVYPRPDQILGGPTVPAAASGRPRTEKPR